MIVCLEYCQNLLDNLQVTRETPLVQEVKQKQQKNIQAEQGKSRKAKYVKMLGRPTDRLTDTNNKEDK